MENTYTVSQAAEKLYVSVKTLQRWDREGKLVAKRTPSNRRYYTETQLNEARGSSFDINDIIETIKTRYNNMKNRGMKVSGYNIMGHLVSIFCNLKNSERKNFICNYDTIIIDENVIATCDIIVGGKNIMSIISPSEEVSEKTSMDWLCNYMDRTSASSGISIIGTKWNLIDKDCKEYSIDFENRNIDKDVFKKFLSMPELTLFDDGENQMEIKQYYVYNMGFRENNTPIEAVVVQNDLQNSDPNYEETTIIYIEPKNNFGGLYNVKKDDLKFEVRELLMEEKQKISDHISELLALN